MATTEQSIAAQQAISSATRGGPNPAPGYNYTQQGQNYADDPAQDQTKGFAPSPKAGSGNK